jgi:hypothetical protein
MSSSVSTQDIVEVFSIVAENIQLSGALVAQKDGQAVASGIIKFGNGKRMAFSSAPDETTILSKRLMSICQIIAECYNAEVIHQDFQSLDRSKYN